MKILKLSLLILLIIGFSACENEEWEFEDFDYTSVYFPYQSPVRNLLLGKYDQGNNDNDNNHQFEIGIVLGGVYSNKEERVVHFTLDNTLLNDVDKVVALPENYYEIVTPSPLVIAKGETEGRITVQLKDEFFNAPLAIDVIKNSVNYVIPMRISDTENVDSILSGQAIDGITDPSISVPDHWEVLPKDYTLFGIKYINKYHGNYLRRGVDKATNGTETAESVYRAEYVERDEVVEVNTVSMDTVLVINRVRREGLAQDEDDAPVDIQMLITFDEDNNCVIKSAEENLYNITGTGKLVEDGDSWGGKQRDVIYLDYNYLDPVYNETHQVNDTLVIRDRDVVFEQFTITSKSL
jgi:hypothetical protein